jgi:hypothetical protein
MGLAQRLTGALLRRCGAPGAPAAAALPAAAQLLGRRHQQTEAAHEEDSIELKVRSWH